MNLLVGVTLLVIQLSSTRAVHLDDASRDSLIDLKKPSSLSTFTSLPFDEISVNKENLVTATRKIRQATNREKADDIVYDIKSRSFSRALEKMESLKDDIQGTMNYVTHEVYNNNVGNFGLILQFLDSNQNMTTSLAIYDALYYEMNNNNHNDHLLRLRVIKSFNSKHLYSEEAEKLKRELHKTVSDILVEELKNAVKTKNSTTISTISENIYNNYRELFDEVIKQVVNETFDKIDKRYLVKLFMSHQYASQRIYVYSAMFEELKKRNGLNQSFVVFLASAVKEALALKRSLDSKSYTEGYRLKSAFPTSIRNLAFASPVCIVNKNEEYLYGASDGFIVDDNDRPAFTWMPKDKVSQGEWIIERHGDVYRIKNYRNVSHSEYMYGPKLGFSNSSPSRRIYTWVPGGTMHDSEEFNWTFEPKGPFVYIKYERQKEYLFSGGKLIKDRRYVYTDRSKVKESVKGSSLWMIENCSPYAVWE